MSIGVAPPNARCPRCQSILDQEIGRDNEEGVEPSTGA
jgi:hypothetical protein